MPKTIADIRREVGYLKGRGFHTEVPRGVISAPSADELKPSRVERAYLESLWRWHKESARSVIILGIPMNEQPLYRS